MDILYKTSVQVSLQLLFFCVSCPSSFSWQGGHEVKGSASRQKAHENLIYIDALLWQFEECKSTVCCVAMCLRDLNCDLVTVTASNQSKSSK